MLLCIIVVDSLTSASAWRDIGIQFPGHSSICSFEQLSTPTPASTLAVKCSTSKDNKSYSAHICRPPSGTFKNFKSLFRKNDVKPVFCYMKYYDFRYAEEITTVGKQFPAEPFKFLEPRYVDILGVGVRTHM